MTTPFDIITLGYIFEETIKSGGRTQGPFLGGTVSYSSLCLANCGARTGIVSNIGNDTPSPLLQPFFDAGVDTAGLNRREGASATKNILIYDDAGNKRIEYLTRAPVIEFTDIPDDYLNAKIFYLCPVDFEIGPECVAQIKRSGVTVAADLGGFGGAHVSQDSRAKYLAQGEHLLRRYMASIDIVRASLEDCSYLFPGAEPNPEDLAQRLLDLGGEIVIVTLGEDGALVRTRQDLLTVPAIRTDVVDCTGAGDTFTSAFLAEYLASSAIDRAAAFASAAASLLIEKSGGASVDRIPGRREIIERAVAHGYLS